jgi:hypothetical protein
MPRSGLLEIGSAAGGTLIGDPIERYTIERRQDGVVVVMRQAKNALRVGLFAVGILLVTWWSGPYRPHASVTLEGPWLWSYWSLLGLCALFVLASLLAAFYHQDVTIADKEIIAEASFFRWKRTRRTPRARALGIWTETVDNGGERGILPFRMHLLDADGKVSGFYLALGQRRSVDEVLAALGEALTLDVRDRKSL